MVKWEYTHVPISSSEIDNLPNLLGGNGWELISVNKEGEWYDCIFKRPKKDNKEYEYFGDLIKQVRELRETIDKYYDEK